MQAILCFGYFPLVTYKLWYHALGTLVTIIKPVFLQLKEEFSWKVVRNACLKMQALSKVSWNTGAMLLRVQTSFFYSLLQTWLCCLVVISPGVSDDLFQSQCPYLYNVMQISQSQCCHNENSICKIFYFVAGTK